MEGPIIAQRFIMGHHIDCQFDLFEGMKKLVISGHSGNEPRSLEQNVASLRTTLQKVYFSNYSSIQFYE